MSPYPQIYVPRAYRGPWPLHSPHVDRVGLEDGCGPDDPGGGTLLGGCYRPEDAELWHQTVLGWWIRWTDPTPQQLVNLMPSPQLVRWHWIAGAQPGQRWRVPVILTPLEDTPDTPWEPCTNRIWNGQDYELPAPLASIQHRLLAIAMGIRLVDDTHDNDAAMRHLTIDLLACGHHVSEAEMVQGRWLDERLMVDTVSAALDCTRSARTHQPRAVTEPDHAG